MEISVDLDSTLADTRHRHGIIEKYKAAGEPIDWIEYSQACEKDPLTGFGHFLRSIQTSFRWHVVSGRSEEARPATMKWLRANGLRPAAIFLENGEQELHGSMGHAAWKARRVLQVAEQCPNLAFHVDDWAEVSELVEKLSEGRIRGVTVLAPGHLSAHPTALEDFASKVAPFAM